MYGFVPPVAETVISDNPPKHFDFEIENEWSSSILIVNQLQTIKKYIECIKIPATDGTTILVLATEVHGVAFESRTYIFVSFIALQ